MKNLKQGIIGGSVFSLTTSFLIHPFDGTKLCPKECFGNSAQIEMTHNEESSFESVPLTIDTLVSGTVMQINPYKS